MNFLAHVWEGNALSLFSISFSFIIQDPSFFFSFLNEIYIYSKDKAKDAIFYSYTRHINGFAAFLEDEEAAQIASK